MPTSAINEILLFGSTVRKDFKAWNLPKKEAW